MDKVLINITHQGTVANVILNKPKQHNCLDLELIESLQKYFIQINLDPSIKLLVLSGNGDSFCSGLDLSWLQSGINYSLDENFTDLKKLADLLLYLYNITKPVMCMVHGNVYGGGLGLISGADIAVAADDSRFCFSEIKVGLIPAIVSQFILQKMNFGFAKYSMISAKPFDVRDAYNFGLIHEIVANDKLKQKSLENIEHMLSLDHNSLVATKQLLIDLQQNISIEKLNHGIQLITARRLSSTAQKLMSNFLNNSKK